MKAIRIGICVLVAFSVIAHGAVEAWSETVLEMGAVVLLICWAALFASKPRLTLRWNWLVAPVLGLWMIALVQYFARWSAVPFLTEIEILKLSALLILLFLAVQAYETLEQWRGFVWFLLVLGFLVSVQGILQYFTFNGKLYWFRELRYGGVPFGPYVDRDHFSGLIELIAPCGLSLLFARAEDRDRLPLLTVLTLVPIGALFLAASRGGIASFSVELGLVVILVFLHRRSRSQLVVAALIVVLTGAFVAWLGVGRLLDRFASYRKLEVTEGRRTEIIKDSWRIFVAHPIAGTGLGTLEQVFPLYETRYDGFVVNHSHNDYVEGLAETGLLGGICGLLFLAIFFGKSSMRFRSAKDPLDLALHVGAFSSCCGILVHSLVDFNLHIPSNALLFLLQAALATYVTRQFQNGAPEEIQRKHELISKHSLYNDTA